MLRYAEVIVRDITAAGLAAAGEHPLFEPDKGDGSLGSNGGACDGSGVRIQPGGDVNSEHRYAGPVDRTDQRLPVAFHLAGKAGAKQRIDDDVGIGCKTVVIAGRVTDLLPVLPGLQGITLEREGVDQADNADI